MVVAPELKKDAWFSRQFFMFKEWSKSRGNMRGCSTSFSCLEIGEGAEEICVVVTPVFHVQELEEQKKDAWFSRQFFVFFFIV